MASGELISEVKPTLLKYLVRFRFSSPGTLTETRERDSSFPYLDVFPSEGIPLSVMFASQDFLQSFKKLETQSQSSAVAVSHPVMLFSWHREHSTRLTGLRAGLGEERQTDGKGGNCDYGKNAI